MAFLTTNPNPYILNLPVLQNVANSALGPGSTTGTTSYSQYIDTTTNALSINTINQYTNTLSYVTVNTSLNLASGKSVYINGINALSANTVNGANYLSLQVGGSEGLRLTGGSVGIGTSAPGATLDVNGNTIVRGDLYVNGIHYPSDPTLKTDVRPYTSPGLPTAVRFRWLSTGAEDIGVMADAVPEPLCVGRNRSTLTVDYPKLVVLCIAEIAELKRRVKELESPSV